MAYPTVQPASLPSTTTVIMVAVAIILISLALHLFICHRTDLTDLPAVLILGSSGAGKTTFATALERGTAAVTHTSQTPMQLEIELDTDLDGQTGQAEAEKTGYQTAKKLFLIDTPGHGKLRQLSLTRYLPATNLRGIIFLVDGSNLSPDFTDDKRSDGNLRDCAEYLHDLLLLLQQRQSNRKRSTAKPLSFLIAVNKLDLFTALPEAGAKVALEREITKIRSSRSRSLRDSGIALDGGDQDDDAHRWLGNLGKEAFSFAQLEGVVQGSIEVIGGWSARENPKMLAWQKWILACVTS